MTYQQYIALKPGNLVVMSRNDIYSSRFGFVTNKEGNYYAVQYFDKPEDKAYISPGNFDYWYTV